MHNILQNNIEILKIVIEQSPMPVALYTGPDFKIKFLNKAMQEIWGRDETIIGKKIFDAIPELKDQPVYQLFEYVYNTAIPYKATEDRVAIFKNGRLRTFYFNLNLKPLFDDAKNVWAILHTATDVTQLVMARKGELGNNKALVQSQERFKNMVQQAPVALGILRGKDMKIELANDELLKLWGKKKSVFNLPLLKAIPEIKDQEFIHLLQEVYNTGNPYFGNEKLAYLKRNGRLEECYFNFVYTPLKEDDDSINGVMVTGSEITSQVMSKKKLEQSKKRFRNLIIEAPMATALYKGPELTIEIANDAMLKLWGKDEKVIGEKLEIALPELKGQPFLGLLDQVYSTGVPYHTEQQRADFIVNGKLQSSWFNFTYKPLFDDKGEVYAILNMAVDISTQVHLQKQKDEFIGIASHELKTPVTVIKSYAQLLEEILRKSGDKIKADMVMKLDGQVNRLNHLIGDLLDVTKINSGKIEFNYTTYDFNNMVKEVVEEIQTTAVKHKIKLELKEVGQMYGDKERTGQAIVNLLTNAIKYSPGADKIIVKSEKKDKEVQLSIQDFGIGISEKQQQRIFEQFYRADEENNLHFSGLGLGLYISSEFVKRIGGHMWVKSKEGMGSTFYFSLPLIAASN